MQIEPQHRRKTHVVKSGVKKPATVWVTSLTPNNSCFKWNSHWLIDQHKSIEKFSRCFMMLVETPHTRQTWQMKTDSIKHFPFSRFVPLELPTHNANRPQTEFIHFENLKTELILWQSMRCQPNTSRMSKRQVRQSVLVSGFQTFSPYFFVTILL